MSPSVTSSSAALLAPRVDTQEPIPSAWLEALSPVTTGVVLGGRLVLDGFDPGSVVKLRFRDLTTSRAFVLRLRPTDPDARRFANAGRIDIILDLEGPLSPPIERFVRALAQRMTKNTEALSTSQIAALFPVDPKKEGGGEVQNPYLRRFRMGEHTQVDLRVGSHCNEACVFCTDVDNRGDHVYRDTAFWMDTLARVYEGGRRGVLFVGNEPTLRTDLPTLVAEAKRLGYTEIELSTNGVRLSDRAYLAELLDAGLNVLTVSVHGADAELEGLTTGRPEFHVRRFRGFENFVALVGDRAEQARKQVFLRTVTVLTTLNLAGLPALVHALDQCQVTYMVFHYPWIRGDAERLFTDVVPDYAAVAEAFAPLRERLMDASGDIALANLPPCVMGDLQHGRTRFKEVVDPQWDSMAARNAQPAKNTTGIVPARSLNRARTPAQGVSNVARMDPSLTHTKVCASCAARTECLGVSQEYQQTYGSLGLRSL